MSAATEAIQTALDQTREREAKLKRIADELPTVRREIRELEKTLARMKGTPTAATSRNGGGGRSERQEQILGLLREVDGPLDQDALKAGSPGTGLDKSLGKLPRDGAVVEVPGGYALAA